MPQHGGCTLALHAPAHTRCICAQIRYMLGDGGRSLVVGTGSDPPQFLNVQSASCPSPPATCPGQAAEFSGAPNPQVAMGSLIYGDSANNDAVSDSRIYSANMAGVRALLLQPVPSYAVLSSCERCTTLWVPKQVANSQRQVGSCPAWCTHDPCLLAG